MKLLKKLIVVSFALSAFGYYAFSELTTNRVLANATTPPLTFHTGAPNEFVCTECHTSFPLNSGGGSVQITGLPATYTLGQTYTVTVTVTLATARRWGFELTAVDATGNGASSVVGNLNLLPSNTTTTRRIDSDSVLSGGKTRIYISHSANGTFPGETGPKSWSFNWVAPASNAGNITFYAAGNAANNSANELGDRIYTTSVVVASPSSNNPPTFAATPNRVLGVGDKISFTVSATDQDSDPVTISASTPTNGTFDQASKRFTFTPAANQVGTTQQVTFTASDGKSQTQQTVSLQVMTAISQSLASLTKSGVSKYLDSSGATQIDLTVLGNFDVGAAIIFNGMSMTTQSVTGGLAASLPASELTTPGAYPVRVRLGNGALTNARALALASSINTQTTATADAATSSPTVAPGQIASLYGLDLVVGSGFAVASSIPLPRSLQSTTVYVNGVSAPLFFTFAGQINYQMPYSTAVGQASIVVLRDDGVAAYGIADIAATVPALFTANTQGFGQAVALNQDFSYNGDPAANPQAKRAKKGEYVTLYGSGAGAQFVIYGTAPPQALTINDGEAASGNPLAATMTRPVVTIGGIESPDVFFSGLAPGFVGLWQLNVQIPPNAPSGAAVNLIITHGGGISRTVTLAIE